MFGNHVSSEVAIMSVATYFMVKNYRQPARYFGLSLCVIAIHEFGVLIENVFYGWSLLGQNYKYYGELGAILFIGMFAATRGEKIRLVKVAIVVGAFEVFWALSLVALHINPFTDPTISGFDPGPAFYNIPENSLEVGSWIVASLAWLLA